MTTEAAAQTAPDDLDLVVAFVNTWEGILGTTTGDERLETPAALEDWMREAGIPLEAPLSEEDLRRARRFREGLRALMRANCEDDLDRAAIAAMREASASTTIRVQVGDDGALVEEPLEPGLPALFGRLLATVARAQATGSWSRVKACAADDCHWAFYDQTRNRSRTWCTMEVCGNRAKTRRYRSKRSGGQPADSP